jgi:hypothetical protein
MVIRQLVIRQWGIAIGQLINRGFVMMAWPNPQLPNPQSLLPYLLNNPYATFGPMPWA